MRRRQRPQFLCANGCGRRVWREHTFCSSACERFLTPSLFDKPPLLEQENDGMTEQTFTYDPSTEPIPF